jgi:hypothetical protein
MNHCVWSQSSFLQNNSQIILEHKLGYIVYISVEFTQEQVKENPVYDVFLKKESYFSHIRRITSTNRQS